MIKIRYGVFETNSSSVHSLILCSDEEYKAFEKHQLYYNRLEHHFMTREEVRETIVKLYKKDKRWFEEAWNEFLAEEDMEETPASIEAFDALPLSQQESFINIAREGEIKTLDGILEDEYLESFDETYVTKSGEVVHAFGNYGNDY